MRRSQIGGIATVRRILATGAALCVAGLPGIALAYPYPLIKTTDPAATYTASTGVLKSGANAVVLNDVAHALGSSTFSIELHKSGAETAGTVNTLFTGPADITMVSGSTVLLSLSVASIKVTNIVPGPPGATATSINVGNLAEGQSLVTITGGTLAGDFGGIGAEGTIFAIDNKPTKWFLPGQVFNTNFSAQMNVQIQIIPEPGSLLLVAAPLLGMLWARRRPGS